MNFKKVFLGLVLFSLVFTGSVFADTLAKEIMVYFNKINIQVNGKNVNAPNILYEGKTYVQLREVSEMLGKDVGWDGKTNTASINDKSLSTLTPKSDKTSLSNPGDLNKSQTITVDDYTSKYTAEINVKEITRGEDAWKMLDGVNMFNKRPEDINYEYLIAKVYVKVLDIDDNKKLDFNGSVHLDIISESGNEYDLSFGTAIIEPNANFSLYKGASQEGYAVHLVKKDDLKPKLAYGRSYDGSGGIWFKGYN